MALDLLAIAAQLEQVLLQDTGNAALQTLVARLQRDLAAFPPPPPPTDYRVIATDGSQIEPERGAPVDCYVVNIGEVVLEYGAGPFASLGATATLATRSRRPDDDEGDDEGAAVQERVQVDLERSVQEMERLAVLVATAGAATPTLALQDGSLLLWTAAAQRYQRETQGYVERYVAALDQVRRAAGGRELALASYISLPGSREVASQLGEAAAEQLLDRRLFGHLRPGERSQVYPCDVARRPVMRWYAPAANLIRFFYLNPGDEIARVEVPAWVADDPPRLDFVHGALLHQCRVNLGYPVALMEAHEQAVVTEGDRRAFWNLVAATVVRAGGGAALSGKDRSKRMPWS